MMSFRHTYARPSCFFFFFNDTATTEIYTLSLHDALPILRGHRSDRCSGCCGRVAVSGKRLRRRSARSEEHTSELQSLAYLVCRLLLEKKKNEQAALHDLSLDRTPGPTTPRATVRQRELSD